MTINISMPVGIPFPDLDFTQDMPARPKNWINEVPGYYYIDQVNGTKTPTYGTPSNPRSSIPKPAPAGSYIEIAGEYSDNASSGARVFSFDGTGDTWEAGVKGPVWVTEAKDRTENYITKISFQVTGSHVFLSNLKLKNSGRIQIGSNSAGYSINNAVVRYVDTSGSGLNVLGNVKNAANGRQGTYNIILYKNTTHDAGDISSPYDEDAHLYQVQAGCENVWLLDNIGHTASGAGLQVLGSSARGTTTRIFAGRNHIYDVRQAGMWVKEGSNIVFSENNVHDIINTSWSPSKGMGAQYAPDNFWLINNVIHGCKYGVRVASTSTTTWDMKVYIIGNVIYDITKLDEKVGPIENSVSSWQPAGIHIAGAQEHIILNNLIFKAPNGIDISNPRKTVIKNNIVLDVTYGQKSGETGYHLLSELQDLHEGEVIMNNNYLGDNMKVEDHHGRWFDVESLNSVEGVEGNVQGTNFIDEHNIGELLSTGSLEGFDMTALMGFGADVSDVLVDLFASLFPDVPEGINGDMFSRVRVQGNGIDIGPFEVGDEFLSVYPLAPVNLRINEVNSSLEWTNSTLNIDTTELYKNGILLTNAIETGVSSYYVEGLSSSVSEYYIRVVNDLGDAISGKVVSDIVTSEIITGDYVEDLSDDKGYLLPRTGESALDGVIINYPTFSPELPYGLPNDGLKYTINSEVISDGYVYVEGTNGNNIAGNVVGDGVVEVILVCVNRGKSGTTAEFLVNDTVVKITNPGGTVVVKVSVSFEGGFSYEYSATTYSDGSAIGISAIIEK